LSESLCISLVNEFFDVAFLFRLHDQESRRSLIGRDFQDILQVLINFHDVGEEHFSFKCNRSGLHNFLVRGRLICGEVEYNRSLVVENDLVV